MGVRLNGNYVAAANASVRLDRELFKDILEINLTSKIDPAFVKAVGSSVPVGRTDGEEESNGDFSLPEQQMAYFRRKLASKHSVGSYGLVEFDIRVQFDNRKDPVIEIVARKCRIIEQGTGIKGGDANALGSKAPLSIMWVERDKLRMINPAVTAFAGLL
jgi:hypothetical protein